MPDGPDYDFDHVAVAVHDATATLELLVGRLGATPLFGAQARGFRWMFLHVGTAERGMFLEVLEPWSTQDDPFLVRFLEAKGEGAHHVTLKTAAIGPSIRRLEQQGLTVIDQRLDNPRWREAFLSPRDTFGTVVQIAETTVVRPPVAEMLATARDAGPEALLQFAGGLDADAAAVWWQAPQPASRPIALERVVFGVRDPERAARFYEQELGGRRDGDELRWKSGARVRFDASANGRQGIVALEFEPAPFDALSIGETRLLFGA